MSFLLSTPCHASAVAAAGALLALLVIDSKPPLAEEVPAEGEAEVALKAA